MRRAPTGERGLKSVEPAISVALYRPVVVYRPECVGRWTLDGAGWLDRLIAGPDTSARSEDPLLHDPPGLHPQLRVDARAAGRARPPRSPGVRRAAAGRQAERDRWPRSALRRDLVWARPGP